MDAGAPAVPGVVAVAAAPATPEHEPVVVGHAEPLELLPAVGLGQVVVGLGGRVVARLALGAEALDESLGDDAEHRVGAREGVDPQVD